MGIVCVLVWYLVWSFSVAGLSSFPCDWFFVFCVGLVLSVCGVLCLVCSGDIWSDVFWFLLRIFCIYIRLFVWCVFVCCVLSILLLWFVDLGLVSVCY